jgi:hypothetical protein
MTVVLVLGLVLLADKLGLVRPSVSLSGAGGGAADPVTGSGSIRLEVSSRSLVPERIASVDVDYPGLTVTSARFEPSILGFGESGILVLEVVVDCEAHSEDGSAAWSEEATTFAEADMTLSTHRPWGTASRTTDRASGTVISTAGLTCLP